MKPKDILDKYDEEIEGKKMESFQLGKKYIPIDFNYFTFNMFV